MAAYSKGAGISGVQSARRARDRPAHAAQPERCEQVNQRIITYTVEPVRRTITFTTFRKQRSSERKGGPARTQRVAPPTPRR
jgi:hypothetical protein